MKHTGWITGLMFLGGLGLSIYAAWVDGEYLPITVVAIIITASLMHNEWMHNNERRKRRQGLERDERDLKAEALDTAMQDAYLQSWILDHCKSAEPAAPSDGWVKIKCEECDHKFLWWSDDPCVCTSCNTLLQRRQG
jgi:hypothetical protein